MGDSKGKVKEEKKEILRKFRKTDDPFYGMNGYRDAPSINFTHEEIIFPSQITMFDGTYSPRGLMNRQGHFFERVAHARYGGKVKNIHEVISGELETNILSWFDLIDPNGTPREAKSVRSGSSIKLMDNQVSRQAQILANGDYDQLVYEIIRHRVRNIQSRFGGQRDIGDFFSEMRDNIQAWISLDFSIIFETWNPKTTKLRRYVPKDQYWAAYGSYTSLSSSTLTKLLKNPEQGLADLGLNPNNYEYEKRKYVSGVIANGRPLHPFPIISINHRSPSDWYSGFRSQDLSWLSSYFDKGSEEVVQEEEKEEDSTFFDDSDISFDPEALEKLPPSKSSDDEVPF